MRNLKSLFLRGFVCALVFTCLDGHVARADTISAGDSSGNLWQVDTGTGAATLVGNMGVVMTDIAFSSSGALFGITFSALYSVNPTTAASTLIGPLGLFDANALTFDSAGTLFTATVGTGQLLTVNPSTGATTLVGSTGFFSGGDLAFSPGGTLFMSTSANKLITVNPSTGAGALVGAIGFSDVFGLDFVGGTLFGLTLDGQLISINTATGAGTLVAKTSPTVAAFGASATPIPEPATLLLLSSGLAACGILRKTRRRAP